MNEIWPKPIPLDRLERPPYPVNALPQVIRDYVVAVAESLQVPVDLPANLIMTAISAPLSKRFCVQVLPDWVEPCNLYSVTALPPAHRKSATFKAVTDPIEEMEKRAYQNLAPLVRKRASEIKIMNARLKQAEKWAMDAEPNEQAQAMDEVHKLQEKIPEPLHLPRLVADNVTQEKLVSLLADNGGRLALLSAEGGIFNIMDGQYNKSGSGPDIDVFLKAHAGDHIRTDRMTRTGDKVDNAALTIGLTVQPEVLLEMVQNPAFRKRGLPARFLFSYPHAPLGTRLIDTPAILPPIKHGYSNLIRRLYKHSLKETGETLLSGELIQLDHQAQALLSEYRHRNEAALGPGQKLEHISDWGGKLCGAIIRLAAVLHACKHPENPAGVAMSADTLASAITLGDYYESHALAVFGQMGRTTSADASSFLNWIVKNNIEQFTARNAFKAVKNKRFETMDALWPVLALLEERHYIRRLPEQERSGPGQKPSPSYEVNPANCAQNRQNRQIA